MKRLLISAAFVLALISFGCVSFAGAQDITGDWQGTWTTGMGELRLVLHITKAADGTLKATIDSPDQAMGGAPLDSISIEGSKVRFTFNIAKGTFEGNLKGNGSISGNWIQGTPPNKYPLTFNKTAAPLKLQHDPAPPSDIDGTWEGIYETPADETGRIGKNHVTFYIKNTADGLTATVDLPDMMNIKGWPATTVTRKGNSIKINLKQISVIFEAKINKALDAMTGDWIQSDGPARALNLKRTKADTSAEAPKQAAPKQ
ncbi:MAG TPA: hypothetical protein VMD99_09995 [Terriglobales bacterium]|nr:hypothetical protein [Terriglobales bacterium]